MSQTIVLQKFKAAKATLFQKVSCIYAAFMLCVYGVGNAYATSASGSLNSLFTKAGDLSNNIVTQITDLYCNKLFPLLFVVNLVFIAFTKDERKMSVEKKALITICVVFVLIKVVDVVTATMNELSAV